MNEATLRIDNVDLAAEGESSYFTVFVNNEIFGLPVENTHTIFRVTDVTPVPRLIEAAEAQQENAAAVIAQWKTLRDTELRQLNTRLEEARLPAIALP